MATATAGHGDSGLATDGGAISRQQSRRWQQRQRPYYNKLVASRLLRDSNMCAIKMVPPSAIGIQGFLAQITFCE